MKTRIIVDSTADLVAEYKKRVTVVPLTVRFGDEEYIDGVTIDHKTFYEKLVESDALLLKYIDDSKHIWDQGLDAVRYTTIGSVIGTHAGPGAVAVAFFKN
ncbi:MAG: DegV family protein [Clostridia bacterium]|nr:DegV family protein [Clostridia bacterium]